MSQEVNMRGKASFILQSLSLESLLNLSNLISQNNLSLILIRSILQQHIDQLLRHLIIQLM
ncbi:hypothetical protein GCM10008014_17860 [Paenibacillus silvae]|uniref:Uncharacterized protein n=1 Tax=Paenibacillus silvae TaxID=1325358 RepID=A0ABQ1Z8P2_9BACL|nr:hypothetical protein GCM10008014_17860 [Paenibacillus silvae]